MSEDELRHHAETLAAFLDGREKLTTADARNLAMSKAWLKAAADRTSLLAACEEMVMRTKEWLGDNLHIYSSLHLAVENAEDVIAKARTT